MHFEEDQLMGSELEQCYYPSDSESCGMQPWIIMQTKPCMASVRRFPSCDLQDLHERELYFPPLAGFIFICDGRRKITVCKRRFLCIRVTSWNRKQILRMKPGTKLFIFDFEARLLSGIFEVTTFPHSFPDSEHESLLKVYFQNYERHEPLEESVFRQAIEENYFSPGKFHAGLSGDQVKVILALYRSQHNWQCLSTHNHPFARDPHAYYNRGKLSSTHNVKAKLSCTSGGAAGTYKKHTKIYEHCSTLRLNAHLTGANAVPLNPRKKKVPAEELLGSDVNHTIANSFLTESIYAAHMDVQKGEKAYSPRVLEDGEFVAPTTMIESSSIDEDYGRVQEPDITDSTARVETRNFIEMLEHNLTSNSNMNSIFCTSSTSPQLAATVQSNDDEAESPAKDKATDGSADATDVLVAENAQATQLIAKGSGKRTRDPFASVLFADREKVKQSVWLRLSDPRPRSRDW